MKRFSYKLGMMMFVMTLISLFSLSCLSILGAPGSTPGSSTSSPSAQRGEELNFSFNLQNPQNYLIYPAVGAAYNNLLDTLGSKTARLRDIDCLGNQFSIRNCVAERRAFDLISYQINISYQNNQLIIEFTNIDAIGSNIMQYSSTEVESLPAFNTQRIAEQLKNQIEQTLANTTAYNTAKQAFLANNDFLSRAFVPVTNAMLDEFANALFMNGEIGLNVSILNVNRNENAEFSNYSTMISAGLYPSVTTSGAFAVVNLYTNDSSLAQLRQSQRTMLSGQVIRLERTAINYRFIMTK